MPNPTPAAVTELLPVTLAECPVGLFWCGDTLALKTEYGNNEGRIDAYIVSSGEFFWGHAPQTIASQRATLVVPVDTDIAETRLSASCPAEPTPDAPQMEGSVGEVLVPLGEHMVTKQEALDYWVGAYCGLESYIAFLKDVSATARNVEAARDELRRAGHVIEVLAALQPQQSAPKINVRMRDTSHDLVTDQMLPVLDVEPEDDGSFTAIVGTISVAPPGEPTPEMVELLAAAKPFSQLADNIDQPWRGSIPRDKETAIVHYTGTTLGDCRRIKRALAVCERTLLYAPKAQSQPGEAKVLPAEVRMIFHPAEDPATSRDAVVEEAGNAVALMSLVNDMRRDGLNKWADRLQDILEADDAN